jgi:hypothetical protein
MATPEGGRAPKKTTVLSPASNFYHFALLKTDAPERLFFAPILSFELGANCGYSPEWL